VDTAKGPKHKGVEGLKFGEVVTLCSSMNFIHIGNEQTCF
jgi:hypothetical protein